MLILISESASPLSSTEMANSVGTNPSFVRKVLGPLKKAGFITSRRGAKGFVLVQAADDISLLQIYEALYGSDKVCFFEMHKNPNDKCLVGRYIRPTLDNTFESIQGQVEAKMAETMVADCIADMRQRAKSDGAL